mgnify:CR=1 FL=1
MENKEFKIGDKVRFGLISLLVYENNGCVGCYFVDKPFACNRNGIVGECLGECYCLNRTDGKSVIFAKFGED